MKLPHKIFWKYRNKNFPEHWRFQLGIYEGFRMFVIRLMKGFY
jgi:hypothetical protein